MDKLTRFACLLPVWVLVGCASVTPTTETRPSYAIYSITPAGNTTAGAISEAVKRGLQRSTSDVRITTGIPPYPLPDEPGRFRLVSPFGEKLGALAASAGNSVQIPVCDNAIVSAYAADRGMANYGENTTFFMCVLPYTQGYHLNVYTTFTMTSGGFTPEALGAALARSVVGDSSQFIPRTIDNVITDLRQTGATVTLVESYP